MKIFNLFPLTVIQDKIFLEDNERDSLISEIKKMKNEDKQEIKSNYAWTGDTKGHEFLFSKELFKSFDDVIKERADKKITSEMTFIGIKETKVLDVNIEGSVHNVKTKFVSEIVNCLKNEKSEVIEGDPEQIKLVTDVWVFRKDLKSSDPTWYLTELSSEEETKH